MFKVHGAQPTEKNVSGNSLRVEMPFGCFTYVSQLQSYISMTCTSWNGGSPRGVMVKAMDYGIVVREFVLQSHYYVHFRANTAGKGMNPLILPAMG